MATRDQLENIFIGEEIDVSQLKNFLELILNQLADREVPSQLGGEEYPEEEEEAEYYEEFNQARTLSALITQCEERLAKLAQNPKTRIVIRNEGPKLQEITDSLECLKLCNDNLQAQIDNLRATQKKQKIVECKEKLQNYQDMIDRLQVDSANSDICNLRRIVFCVQNQVDEMAVKVNELTEDVVDIQDRIKILDIIPELESKVNKLLDWRATLLEEFNLFTERYEHLKTVKAGKCEVHDLLEAKVSYCHLSRYVEKRVFDLAKQDFINEFNDLKELFCELRLFLSAKLVSLNKEVNLALSQLASKRRRERKI